MEKKITNNDPEWAIFRGIFKIYEQFGQPEKDDQYWEDLVFACETYVKDHKNHKLAQNLAIAVMNTLNDMIQKG